MDGDCRAACSPSLRGPTSAETSPHAASRSAAVPNVCRHRSRKSVPRAAVSAVVVGPLPPGSASCCRRAAPPATPAGRVGGPGPVPPTHCPSSGCARPRDRHRHRSRLTAVSGGDRAAMSGGMGERRATTRPTCRSRPDPISASRKSTGMPSAMLAAISRSCRSPDEHGNTPAPALRPPPRNPPPPTARPVNTCRARPESDVTEVPAPQPLLDDRSTAPQPLANTTGPRPRPQPGRKVLETGSKSGGRFRRFRMRS